MASVRIGISGWRYSPWRGTFYPGDLPQKDELSYAASKFPTVEINGSFYSLQRPSSYLRWYQQTPPNFMFSVKGGRFITHMRKLREIETPLANFFASGVLVLKEKLGPILWQFPPNLRYDPERFKRFFELLPRDTNAAVRLARKCDARMEGRAALVTDTRRDVRHAIEIRHESFVDAGFIDLLRVHNIALVVAETAKKWPMTNDVTADFMYIRLHGDKELYRSGYGLKALERWARRISAWHRGAEPADATRIAARMKSSRRARDVFCYFDNTDVKLRAPVDAQTLMSQLRLDYRPRAQLAHGNRASAATTKARPPRCRTDAHQRRTDSRPDGSAGLSQR
jgi:uncharacterized protein YecE (DUF72 family)